MTSPRTFPLPFIPLTQLLEQGRSKTVLVAFGRRGASDFDDFRARVAGTIDAIRDHPRGTWLVHCHDSYAAAISFFALLHAGRRALLLPSRQPGVFRGRTEGAIGALLDQESTPPVDMGLPRLDPLATTKSGPQQWDRLNRDAFAAEFLTSGTSGESKTVPKHLRHLEDEVAGLETRFEARLSQETRVFATVSPQHIYGLLFRILWPLCAGRAFWRDPVLHPEEFLPSMVSEADSLLATTPVLLKSPKLQRGLATLSGSCRVVFSSGGPLASETASQIHTAIGQAPIEVLGSTETGGIAIRQQQPGAPEDPALWEPLPGVEIDIDPADQRMIVASPFVSVGPVHPGSSLQSLVTGDRIQLKGKAGFQLDGRADRVVKVGEKRLALPEMERALMTHPWVEDAALIVLRVAETARVHAAVALTAEGAQYLEAKGRLQTHSRLSAHLGKQWDGILIPRVWRFPERLPRDSQGKLPSKTLQEFFATPDPAPVLDPLLHAESRNENSFERSLEVPANLAFLEGHFPGQPIVPGVVQLRWALECAQQWLGAPIPVARIEALKFHEVLRPGDRFDLTLELGTTGDRLRILLHAKHRVFSSARCILREPMRLPETAQ